MLGGSKTASPLAWCFAVYLQPLTANPSSRPRDNTARDGSLVGGRGRPSTKLSSLQCFPLFPTLPLLLLSPFLLFQLSCDFFLLPPRKLSYLLFFSYFLPFFGVISSPFIILYIFPILYYTYRHSISISRYRDSIFYIYIFLPTLFAKSFDCLEEIVPLSTIGIKKKKSRTFREDCFHLADSNMDLEMHVL